MEVYVRRGADVVVVSIAGIFVKLEANMVLGITTAGG